jgi:hypothetical protein
MALATLSSGERSPTRTVRISLGVAVAEFRKRANEIGTRNQTVGTTKPVIAIRFRRQNDRVIAIGVVMNLHPCHGNSPFVTATLASENASQIGVYHHRGVSSASHQQLLFNGRIHHYPAYQSSAQTPHHETLSNEKPHPHYRADLPDATIRHSQYEIPSAELRLPDLQRGNGTGTETANHP